ncbi:insulinase family protein [Rhizobacter sp. AJA081-3]|uniref:M16 family metallopeptidase n=1 Tax=Rhizobacter sp. AJA081-3 TaxID=2753607 RepID=UPI001ADEF6CA|nr:pitrilysin family protein [Rhizobacter sp. AJA081-3]QTN22006.1 insulinase family protein [Rhizobacter sp. AJA081-3]
MRQTEEPGTTVTTLANGVRVVVLAMPGIGSASVSVFVRTGSAHESARLNGISHVVEHMAFKGTRTRDCQRINLDAERLGAEVNAHTDKDHTAYHMRGLAAHAPRFVRMLGDIVRESTFPEEELERERRVILHEVADDEDDPLTIAFQLFDRASFGTHPAAQPVIGRRANISRFTRDDLLGYVQRQYSGANVVVGVAGDVDGPAVLAAAQATFGSLPTGEENTLTEPAWVGGVASKRLVGSSQTHVVIGYPIGALVDDDPVGPMAAAVLGEGMSSPLLDRIRERKGLAYHTHCSADVLGRWGQFVIEASTGPEHLDEFCTEVRKLLRAHARGIDAVQLERARNQLAVRALRSQEQPYRRVEEACLDLLFLGRVRPRAQSLARLRRVSAARLAEAFGAMLAQPVAAAVTGRLPRSAAQRVRERLA